MSDEEVVLIASDDDVLGLGWLAEYADLPLTCGIENPEACEACG